MVAVSVWRSLRRPREQLRSFDAARPTLARLPYDVWGRFTAIALVGSALYGASLSLVLPGWRALGGALWMGLSAGLSWCIFWPALALLARRSFFSVAHACLVSIAYGEAVLVSGAIGNLLLRFRAARRPNPTAYNWGVVGLANVLMAALLTRQLGALGVPAWKTLLAWLAILDGGGVACSGSCGACREPRSGSEPLAWRWPMLLQKNPLTIVGTIQRCWLFTYQMPADAARRLLPPQLEPVTRRDRAFFNVVVSYVRAMRPKGLPALVGVSYWHVGYRLYVHLQPAGGPAIEGLYFLRSDCDSRLMAAAGNLMTDFNFHTARIEVVERDDGVEIEIASPDAPAGARLSYRAPPSLSPISVFDSLDEAAAFLKYQPFGISIDATGWANVVRISRREEAWRSRLVQVEQARWAFFEGLPVAPEICYSVEPIDYQWNRGRVLRVRPPVAAASQACGSS